MRVNSRTVRLLDLDKILARLEEACASGPGRALVQALTPSNDIAEVRSRLAHTSQARSFADEWKAPAFGGLSDLRPALQSAAIGSVLDASQLLGIARLAAGTRRLKEHLTRAPRDSFPLLQADAAWIVTQPHLEKAIFDAIDDDTGEIKDDASLELLRARRASRQAQAQIQTRLRQMLADPNVQPHLQDAFVTVRDGRYCLPVKADSRARVPGLVHDRSASGGAFFVEPQAVIELNNRLRELAADEKEAIRAILQELSAHVAGAAEDLRHSLEAAARLDFAFAKATLSQRMNGREVPVNSAAEQPLYRLLQACHPLVQRCVANDIFLGESGVQPTGRPEPADPGAEAQGSKANDGFDVMLITGPNTGGKTVVLKTLGLLTMMTSCGLHIPVDEGSALSIPGDIFADIGDEQSIEQSLSTFSSHIKNIISILQKARAGDLVLLDEAGAGTDPDEGAALAKAMLRALQRRGCQVVATTHYGELKQFALSARRFRNASVEFDIKTLRPTYRLRIGVPGASNALDIAARLGMPQELVQRARRYLGQERQNAEEAAQRLEETQRELTSSAEAAARERDEVAKLRRDYQQQLEAVQRNAQREVANARRDAADLVAQTRREADEILRSLRRAARSGAGESKETEAARTRLRGLEERTGIRTGNGAVAQLEASANEAGTNAAARSGAGRETKAPAERLSRPLPDVGGGVLVKNLDKEGILLTEPDARGRCEVRIGAMKLRVARENLEGLAPSKPGGIAGIQIRKSVTVPEEINFIGQTTADAIPQLEKYLDDAILADTRTVRVVHGKGTGALRNAVHRALARHHGVSSYELAPQAEGGEGATIVKLG